MGTAVRWGAALGALAVAGIPLWGCSGDMPEAQPHMTRLPATANERAVDSDDAEVPDGTMPIAAAVTLPVLSSFAEPVTRGIGAVGWVEDTAWAEASPFAGSKWRLLDAPAPLGPSQRDGVRIGAAPGDTSGALWQADRDIELSDAARRIYDMCDLHDAVDRYTSDGRWPLQSSDVGRIHVFQDELDCDGDGVKGPLFFGYERGRYRALGRDFDTRQEAVAYIERFEHQMPHRYSHTLPVGAEPLGLNLCSGDRCLPGLAGWLAIEYSRADASVDEVRVLPRSLSVIDGVLRGLIRNWSRDSFAYSVSVTAGGRTWEWPLSMQPGEAAPFEFEDWTAGEDPLAVEYTVTAQMSPDIDRTRHWRILYLNTLLPEEFHEALPQEVIDRLNPGENEALGYYEARPALPERVDSHPSLTRVSDDRADGEWPLDLPPPEFKPLVYTARFAADGKVTEVTALTPTSPGDWDADGTFRETPLAVERVVPSLDGYVGFYIAVPGRFVWVGGADTAPTLR
ncbi:MAG: hypothetical protein OXB99_15500 [Acidimicrobiaceae bacterium]|nr:hypothetical protein [Acidimicrobiaceae bacterium]